MVLGGIVMVVWRLLKLGTYDAFTNMSIDEAILRARIEKFVPNTIRFYRWNPSAVSIGRFQSVENEVQLDNCRKYGVDVVRRMTGGGTVYHDAEDEITYSVVANKKDLEAPDVTAVYAKIYSGLGEAAKTLGVKVDFAKGDPKTCPNLTVNDRKISGSAQFHKKGAVLQHGTLLVDVDLEKMFTFLRVPWGKTRMEVVNVGKRKITSLSKRLGRDPSIEEVNNALVDGFQKALNIRLVEGELTYSEGELAERLHKEKYVTDEWIFHGRSIFEKSNFLV
jgi:lipoate-protein ligase A